MRTVVTAALLAVAISGCNVVSDVDRFEQGELCPMSLHLRRFNPHNENYFQVDTINNDGQLQSRVIIDPLSGPNIDVDVPAAGTVADEAGRRRLESEPFRVEFFADFDVDDTGRPDCQFDTGSAGEFPDHTWVEPVDCSAEPILFAHNTNFQNVSTPSSIARDGDFLMGLANMPDGGEAFELRVTSAFDVVVGAIRFASQSRSSFVVRIPDVMVNEPLPLRVELWYDGNGNEAYDPPPTDQAWSFDVPFAEVFDDGRADAASCPREEAGTPTFTFTADGPGMDDIGFIIVGIAAPE